MQRMLVNWTRQNAADALAVPVEALDNTQRNTIRSLAVSVENLAIILRDEGKAECAILFKEALDLYQRIGDRATEAINVFNLGHAYKNIPAIRDLTQAERLYRLSLQLRDERDLPGRSLCLNALGNVAGERFKEARAGRRPETELRRHLNDAIGFFQQALALLPANAVNDLAVIHTNLGSIYTEASDFEHALPHYREAIRYDEATGNLHDAAQTRRNIALALMQAGRLSDAAEYARAARRNFETYGQAAAAEIQKTQQLLAEIEQAMGGGKA